MHTLTLRENGIYFEELLICFNFNMTFAMIIKDFRAQIGTFLSKYAYFAENVTFDPRGAYVWTYPLVRWYFFRRTINMLQFQYDFCYDFSRLRGSN